MTLKLLLDWAQIIYSMKNIKIYPKDWLQLHPYKQSDPTDSYYTNIANRIYGMLEKHVLPILLRRTRSNRSVYAWLPISKM